MHQACLMGDPRQGECAGCAACQPPPADHIEQFFAYAHLLPRLQAVSKPFGDLAAHIVETLPRNPERTVALRKLLEAKDAAVRAAFEKDGAP